jgi:hypothetical protein
MCRGLRFWVAEQQTRTARIDYATAIRRFIPLSPGDGEELAFPEKWSARQKAQGSKAVAQRYQCAMGLDFREAADGRAKLSTKVSMP